MHYWCDWKLVQKTVWRFLKNLKIELPYGSAIVHLGIYLKKTKTLIQKDICTPVFIVALLSLAKIWNNLSVHQWING